MSRLVITGPWRALHTCRHIHSRFAPGEQAGSRKDRKRKKQESAAAEVPALEQFGEDELAAAGLLLEEQISIVRQVRPMTCQRLL